MQVEDVQKLLSTGEAGIKEWNSKWEGRPGTAFLPPVKKVLTPQGIISLLESNYWGVKLSWPKLAGIHLYGRDLWSIYFEQADLQDAILFEQI